MPISQAYLMTATGAKASDAAKYLDVLNAVMEAYEINTHERIAGFLSQIGVESGRLSTVEENLNYRVEALLSIFSRTRITEADAKKFGRTPTQAANQQEIANRIYGGSFGERELGNTKPGDGWKFRGRGLKQITGRANYRACGEALGLDLEDDPDLLLTPDNAARSAGWFWSAKGLNALADTGDVVAMTKRINGGTNGLENRKALHAAAMSSDPAANIA